MARPRLGAPPSRPTDGPRLSDLQTIVIHDGTAGGGVRPVGYLRVIWIGGTTRPTNMLINDIWEHDV